MPQDSGRNAFREPDEPPDSRRLIARRSFWASLDEEYRWLYAVEECRPHGIGVGFEAFAKHLERIAVKAGARLDGPALKPMPSARLPYRDDDAVWEQKQALAASVASGKVALLSEGVSSEPTK